MDISQHTRTRNTLTPQTESVPGREAEMVENSAGGFVFALDKWKMLDRFLILGSEGGTYYVGERDLTKDNHVNLLACIAEDPQRVTNLALGVSLDNRAPKNEPAIYAVALVAATAKDVAVRQAAFVAMRQICRIGTHLFSFAQYYTAFRGWSRMSRSGVAQWYLNQTPNGLATQLLKYKQRNGWSHKDLIRLSHVAPVTVEQRELLKWAVKDELPTSDTPTALRVRTLEALHKPGVEAIVVYDAIANFGASFEMLPTEYLKDPRVWELLIPNMGAHALMRNLGRISSLGIAGAFSDIQTQVTNKLQDHEWMRKNRVHPLNLMVTLAAYAKGEGFRGSLSWKPNQRIMQALEAALGASFKWVEPTGKRILVALDVSGSMSAEVAGMTGVSARMAEVVMALMYIRSEPKVEVVAFDNYIQPLPFSYNTSLGDGLKIAANWHGGRTDLAAPIIYAVKERIEADAFIMFTDNETWAGHQGHPVEWMRKYRQELNPNAKLIVAGMTSTGFSVADPKDAGMLDVVGMDTSVPAVIAQVLSS